MDRRKFSISMVAAAVLAGCGGGGGAGSPDADVPPGNEPAPPQPVELPEFASATSLPAATVFAQTIAEADGSQGVAPGQANHFDLEADFSISDGSDDQFDGALELDIEVGGTTVTFPGDQTYAELTALGPEMAAADGLKTVSFTTDTDWVSAGTCSAVLHPVRDARLQQTLDLTAAAGNPVQLLWAGSSNVNRYNFSDEPYFMQVVARGTAGNLLATLYRRDETATVGTWGTASLNAFAGQVIVLCFEQGTPYGSTVIDDVSVMDTVTMNEYVINGGFETGAAGWTVPATRVAQNVRSGARTLPGVGTVQRTFYTEPKALWGRMTDVFTNTSGAALRARITYRSNLGSDGAGIIYPTPGAPGRGLTAWDGDASDRDVGFVFGAGATATFQSATSMTGSDGNDDIEVFFDVDVPAGGSATLVNFIVFTGTDTGQSAANVSARASQVDAIAADIAVNFRANLAYQRGLTQAQLDTLQNF